MAESSLMGAPSPARIDVAAAVCELFEQHRDRVFRRCLRMLRSRPDAEDALQQTFVNAMQALRAGAEPRFEAAWLLTIARNVCLEKGRSATRRAQLEVPADPDSLDRVAVMPSEASDDDLLAALGQIDVRQREALLLREVRGLSYHEIASALQVSHANVETLIFRGRRSLTRALVEARRLRSGFGFGGLLSNLRSLASGSAAKTAAVLGGCGVTIASGAAIEHSLRHPGPAQAKPVAAAPLEQPVTTERSAAASGSGRKRPVTLQASALRTAARPAGTSPSSAGSGADGPGTGSTVGSSGPAAGAPAAPGGGGSGPVTGAAPGTPGTDPAAPGSLPFSVSADGGSTGVSLALGSDTTGVDVNASISPTDGVAADASLQVSDQTSVDVGAGASDTGVNAGAQATTPAGDASASVTVDDSGVTVSTTLPGVPDLHIGLP